MNKNMCAWVTGIYMALIIIVAVAIAFANNRSGSDSGQTSESQIESASGSMALQADIKTGSREQASSNPGNVTGHSGHNGHMNMSGDDPSRYLTEQDSIVTNMVEDMIVRKKSGNASLGFLRDMIPHRETVTKMSKSYLSYQGKSNGLETITQDIITAQKDELEQTNELARLYEEDGEKDQAGRDAYLEQHSGAFAGDSMSRHVDASGADSLDQAFVEGMIMYHQIAVDMIRDTPEYTDCEEVCTMVQNIIGMQEKETVRTKKAVGEQQESQ